MTLPTIDEVMAERDLWLERTKVMAEVIRAADRLVQGDHDTAGNWELVLRAHYAGLAHALVAWRQYTETDKPVLWFMTPEQRTAYLAQADNGEPQGFELSEEDTPF